MSFWIFLETTVIGIIPVAWFYESKLGKGKLRKIFMCYVLVKVDNNKSINKFNKDSTKVIVPFFLIYLL